MPSSDLTIVIPTFKEKNNLESLIPSIEDLLGKVNCSFQILIVDDNSNDGTSELISQLDKQYHNIKIIVRKDKKGIASAWQDGFNLAGSKFVACMDGDLSHDPKYLVSMFEEIKKNDRDMVIGSRYLDAFCKDFQGKPFLARFTSAFGQCMGRFILGLKQKDISHSFRIFKKDVFERIKDKLLCEGNSYLVEFLYLTVKNNFSVCEIPIKYRKRVHGRTKLKVFKEGIRYVRSLFLIRNRDR